MDVAADRDVDSVVLTFPGAGARLVLSRAGARALAYILMEGCDELEGRSPQPGARHLAWLGRSN